MSVNYTVAVRNNRLQQVVNAIDGAGGSGIMRLLDVSNNILSSLQLARPSGSIASGVLTFSGLPLIDPGAASNGVVAGARIEDSAGNVIVSGLQLGTDIFMPSPAISAGQTVAITAATITGN